MSELYGRFVGAIRHIMLFLLLLFRTYDSITLPSLSTYFFFFQENVSPPTLRHNHHNASPGLPQCTAPKKRKPAYHSFLPPSLPPCLLPYSSLPPSLSPSILIPPFHLPKKMLLLRQLLILTFDPDEKAT